jgi:hypothetical protein
VHPAINSIANAAMSILFITPSPHVSDFRQLIVILSQPLLRSEVEALARRLSRAPKSRAPPREPEPRELSRFLRQNERAFGSLPYYFCDRERCASFY